MQSLSYSAGRFRTSHLAHAAACARRRRGGSARASSADALGEQLAAAVRRRRCVQLLEVALQTEEIDVARCCLLIAQHRTPDLDVEAYLAKLDAMGEELQAFLPPPDARYTRRMLLAINSFLYEHLGFRAASSAEYHTPATNCLDAVLDSRCGIPLTLAIVYLEMAKRAGLPMIGVHTPAHFLIRPVVEDVRVLVDCYNSGEIITLEDAEAMLSPLYGAGAKVKIDASFFEDDDPKPRAMLTRMLTNLKQTYFNAQQYDDALLVIEMQELCAPDESIVRLNARDRGVCLYLLQRFAEAALELRGYLDGFPGAVDREAVEGIISMCRSRRTDGGEAV